MSPGNQLFYLSLTGSTVLCLLQSMGSKKHNFGLSDLDPYPITNKFLQLESNSNYLPCCQPNNVSCSAYTLFVVLKQLF